MSRPVRRTVAAILLVGLLQLPSAAQPAPKVDIPPDPIATPTPWIDLGTSPIASPPDEPAPTTHKLAASLTLGGIYAGFATWTYFAWYRKHHPLSEFKVGGDGWLGSATYAGGADKFGHAWATMSLARAGTELLHQWGGFTTLQSALVATALSEALFLGVEVKDGFYYEFSLSDATGDTLGALAALALSLSPRLDELFDFRVQYWPSHEYLHQLDGGNVNVAEDYSGETYLLAFKPRSIRAIREGDWSVRWLEFINPVIGYETRGYKPAPLPEDMEVRHQNLFFGVTVDMQAVVDETLGRSSSHGARVAASILHTGFEFGNLPFTTIHGGTRSPDEP
jgi:hypothetical protein